MNFGNLRRFNNIFIVWFENSIKNKTWPKQSNLAKYDQKFTFQAWSLFFVKNILQKMMIYCTLINYRAGFMSVQDLGYICKRIIYSTNTKV